MMQIDEYLPRRINDGHFLTAYSLPELVRLSNDRRMVLPVCSLGTPVERLAELAPLVLPPLYHEALDEELKRQILQRVQQCFPYYEGTQQREAFRGQFDIVELSPVSPPPRESPRVLAFSVDTAVEEHGPHLPLATDTIQSYGVLRRLANEIDGFQIGPPVDYGQLTWGLPFGMSIDITAPLLTQYVTRFVNALLDWLSPSAIYVVDVHGSIVHRTAIQEGLKQSRAARWAFRWLHDPLVEFAGERGDQHAGGVETALVQHLSSDLVDANWWPGRVDDIAAGQMSMADAVELSSDLSAFIRRVESQPALNGIVGDVRNFFRVDAELMMNRMLEVARSDVLALIDQMDS